MTPETPNPKPNTLHPSPFTLHHKLYTLHLSPYTIHPTPYTLHLSPYTLHLTPESTCAMCADTRKIAHQHPPNPSAPVSTSDMQGPAGTSFWCWALRAAYQGILSQASARPTSTLQEHCRPQTSAPREAVRRNDEVVGRGGGGGEEEEPAPTSSWYQTPWRGICPPQRPLL